MLGALLAGVVGYKLGQHNSNQHSYDEDDDTNELYRDQLKCVAQCKALYEAAHAGASVNQIIEMNNRYLDEY